MLLLLCLGFFGKEGCGVGLLGDSKLGFNNPFKIKAKKVSKVDTPFEKFDTVIIQGGNPCESIPNTDEVINRLKSVKMLYISDYTKMKLHAFQILLFLQKTFLKKMMSDLAMGIVMYRR